MGEPTSAGIDFVIWTFFSPLFHISNLTHKFRNNKTDSVLQQLLAEIHRSEDVSAETDTGLLFEVVLSSP